MSAMSLQERIKTLILDTNTVFENCGGVNTDYADFATIALAEFKILLSDPSLTDRQLKQIIRKAFLQQKARNSDDCWATAMAGYMANHANSNGQFQQV